ncbi:MAG: sigma-70 family RNA polymerase sigma factor [Clostridia bacterium]|nr:sigma-70 family RNA polymerase sigma factor [Clostridia bacterium]
MKKIIHIVKKWLCNLFLRFFGGDEVYYINGADVLPQPLSAEEEALALAEAPENESMRAYLVEHNLRLVVYISKKFESVGVSIEELISIGTVGLMKAIDTFHADRNIKLATYASRCIENEILMFVRKNTGRKREISIDEPLNVDWDGNELLLSDVLGSDADTVGRTLEEEEEKRAVRDLVRSLSPREREIIELRYGLYGKEELTQKEVADILHISQSYISRLEKKIISRLRKEMEVCY